MFRCCVQNLGKFQVITWGCFPVAQKVKDGASSAKVIVQFPENA